MTVAEDGEAALRLYATIQPDLVLMDIHMPRLDGLEATRRIRAHADPAVAATPIITLTALTCSMTAKRCLAAGANDYLSKPMSFAALMAAIKNQLHPNPDASPPANPPSRPT